ncbi:cold-shock protein [Paracoccus benzoatiresistens]|uniref:Cold shock domain-containing protein n=1 Tax=Paracoccus benzoatiresistens TaxID=2997341 RepID=A0ABT4JAD2_9RHOB|nr:cold shock domain-containing protein [Paracoccus sp. EF6]MCZ0963308.1 cold shock domain-containing protein [Paracoccus sp. EF6]
MFISTTSLGMRDQTSLPGQRIKGQIKWFDPIKGFGFLSDAEEGADVLLHSNVLRSFGQSSIAEDALVEVVAIQTARGRQAVEVLSIAPPPLNAQTAAPIAELAAMSEAHFAALPLLPARVKWFDRNKGFGFANIFGRTGDVFLHIEVLRRCGFVDLTEGEAVALRVFLTKRSMIATEVSAWVNVGGGSKVESMRS